MKVSISHIKQIVKLSRKPKKELKKMNPHWAYHGKYLTKYQLIFQIVFNMDSPNEKE